MRQIAGQGPKSILITGASSGIGAALARLYAAPGVTLALCGRDAARLADVAAACRAKGASTTWARVDVTDAKAVAAWIEGADNTSPIDLVIANAGIGSSAEREERPGHNEIRVFDVNVDGVLNTVLPAVERMRARSPGARGTRAQIAIMSSLASFRGFASPMRRPIAQAKQRCGSLARACGARSQRTASMFPSFAPATSRRR